MDKNQTEQIIKRIAPFMVLDKYGLTTIRNIYFDTDDYKLIRKSIEKPVYKEKLRVRSYQKADSDSTVFVELKKKYQKVVYKRRVCLKERDAMDWLCRGIEPKDNNQIVKEINYFMEFYKPLKPAGFLCYDRAAYYQKDGGDFRVTFDNNILFRENDISLTAKAYGVYILPEDKVLMEIKCSGGIPIWMTKILSEEKIYKTSFSKYGTAYTNIIFPKIKEDGYNVTNIV